MTDDIWNETIKGVKKIESNQYTEDIKPKDVEIRRDKVVTVPFETLKRGYNVELNDVSQMDASLAKKFKREMFKIESVLDLHGTTEKNAFDKVCDFIKESFNAQKRCVLIITGKGLDDAIFSEKGVLRKSVPNWLSNSEISSLILAFKNPSEALGGVGALYILLRKNGKNKGSN